MPVPRRAGGFDECRDGVIERGDFAAQPERLDVPGEFRPAFETVLAGDDELRIRQLKGRDSDGVLRLVMEPGIMPRDPIERRGFGLGVRVEKILGLLPVLLEVGLIG
jgi:hypothetical protein